MDRVLAGWQMRLFFLSQLTHAAKVLASSSSCPRDPGWALAQVWNLHAEQSVTDGDGRRRLDGEKPSAAGASSQARRKLAISPSSLSPGVGVDPELEPLAVDVVRQRLDPVRERLGVGHQVTLQSGPPGTQGARPEQHQALVSPPIVVQLIG
jgi:hypothetical protein